MRRWFSALAVANSTAAQVLTSNPMKGRTLGLMGERASQRTMVSSRTPQARPKALVQLAVIEGPLLAAGRLEPLRTLTDTEENYLPQRTRRTQSCARGIFSGWFLIESVFLFRS